MFTLNEEQAQGVEKVFGALNEVLSGDEYDGNGCEGFSVEFTEIGNSCVLFFLQYGNGEWESGPIYGHDKVELVKRIQEELETMES